MKRIRLTMSQALVKFLDNQYIECDGVETKFVSGMFGIFGHGCVVGVGQALEQGGHNLKFYQGKNEQNMALAAVAYAKQMDRKAIIPCVSSIGPGATNMVTACGCATANRIPLLVLPGDTFACRQPDPVLQQAEFFDNYGRTVTDAFKGVCHYFDRILRPEQLMTACINAMRVLTDPADTGAVCLAMPQDVEGEAYDYPEHFLQKRVWHLDRRPISAAQLERATRLIKEAKKPIIVCGGGVRYSGAENELLEFATKYNIPIAETQAGKGLIKWDNPLNVGGIGVTGGKAANVIGRDADLVLPISQPHQNGFLMRKERFWASTFARLTLIKWMPRLLLPTLKRQSPLLFPLARDIRVNIQTKLKMLRQSGIKSLINIILQSLRAVLTKLLRSA